MKRIGGIWAMSLRILCVLTLISIGLIHNAPPRADLPSQATAEASYMLPDGSMPDQCLGTGEDHKSKPATGCETCRLAANTLLPDPADTIGAPVSFREATPPFIGIYRTLGPQLLAYSVSARGPPPLTIA
ncbi:hypothetical protein J2Z19_005787 [Ensifer adhaerens]|uniref:Uncharacterized protein n=1 Tax=Ensifer adhaerens TaxID=106592 RepID=A0ACC5T5B0_ENSAD|nr:hypothetical protein [Ensifer adhaerens]MBP1876038.1 hypothetical protein [Ensifer adhaerens]